MTFRTSKLVPNSSHYRHGGRSGQQGSKGIRYPTRITCVGLPCAKWWAASDRLQRSTALSPTVSADAGRSASVGRWSEADLRTHAARHNNTHTHNIQNGGTTIRFDWRLIDVRLQFDCTRPFDDLNYDRMALQKIVYYYYYYYGRTLSERPCYILPMFFFYFFFMGALVGQTAERIFTKLSHVVDISCYLRTY